MMEVNKIYNEDCLERMRKIPDCSVDLICTDPPFEIDRDIAIRPKGQDFFVWYEEWVKECHRILKVGRFFWIYLPIEKKDKLKDICKKHFSFVEEKNNKIMRFTKLIPFIKLMPKQFEYQTTARMAREAVLQDSKPDEIVFDPFCGIGTTPIISKFYDRKFIGCEINKERFNKTCNNIEKYG